MITVETFRAKCCMFFRKNSLLVKRNFIEFFIAHWTRFIRCRRPSTSTCTLWYATNQSVQLIKEFYYVPNDLTTERRRSSVQEFPIFFFTPSFTFPKLSLDSQKKMERLYTSYFPMHEPVPSFILGSWLADFRLQYLAQLWVLKASSPRITTGGHLPLINV